MIKGILNFIQVNVGFGFDVESKQALQYFRDKGLRTSFSYADVTAQEHQTAFTVAKMMDIDLLKDVQDSLYAALAEGLTFDQWKDRIIPTLQANGWWGRQAVVDPISGKTVIAELGSARRLQTIFRTNMQSAYAVGQWQKIQEQAKEAPYLMYDAVDDFRTRPQHRAWDNKILPITSTFWTRYYPPNAWGCRCGVIQLSQDDIDSMGMSVSDDPDVKWVNWKNPRTGKIERIPEGIDAGFQINAGMEREKYLKKLAREKAEAIADDLMRDAAKVGLTKSSNAAKDQVKSLPLLEQDKNSEAVVRKKIEDPRLASDEVLRIDENTAVNAWMAETGVNINSVHKSLQTDPEIVALSLKYGLDPIEQASLYYYTGYGADSMNRVLNSEVPFNVEIGKAALVLNRALEKLPSYEGMVVRREKDRYNILETHVEGAIVTHYGFTSTTYGAEDVFPERPIRMIIKSKTGKNLHWISYTKEFEGDEEFEILISPPSQFLIMSRENVESYTDIDGNYVEGYIEIRMQEI